jgi:REP element-mobilizing transposase RayT
MSRKPRVEFPGGLYHVFSRGNRKERIFEDDADRVRFLEKLLEYKKRHDFVLYAYVMLPNHFHLLLETGEHPLSRIMQGFLQSHSQYFNLRHGKVGHVFQGRYRAILCEKDAYLLQLVRYIHLNPLRAGLVAHPADYEWSSHGAYLRSEVSGLVDTRSVLVQFSKRKAEAVGAYRAFMSENLGQGTQEDFYRVTDRRFLGSEEFIEEVERASHVEEVEDRAPRKTLEEIALDVQETTGIDLAALRGRGRNDDIKRARVLFVKQSILHTNAKRKEIARFLDREPSWVTALSRRFPAEKRARM